jgi:hypothetical protein
MKGNCNEVKNLLLANEIFIMKESFELNCRMQISHIKISAFERSWFDQLISDLRHLNCVFEYIEKKKGIFSDNYYNVKITGKKSVIKSFRLVAEIAGIVRGYTKEY